MPTVKEVTHPLRQKSSVAFAKAAADFNGDGLLDEALLLKSTRFSGEGLWIRLSNAQGKFEWVKLDETKWGKEFRMPTLA